VAAESNFAQLRRMFEPRNVALVGASDREGSVGRSILENLTASPFAGKIFPVNSKRKTVLGHEAWPSLKDIPEKLDLVVITIPARSVPEVMQEVCELGVPGAIIITAGFGEIGPEGAALIKQITDMAAKHNVRIVGPNCLGIITPRINLNASFSPVMTPDGKVAMLSQSGALGTAILDWSAGEGFGWSSFVSAGSMVDVDWSDLLHYFGEDDKTKSIAIYMESPGSDNKHVRKFVQAAQVAAKKKPIVMVKAGRTAAASAAAASHTGTLTGRDDVFNAVIEKAGLHRVQEVEDLFSLTEFLTMQPLPKGKRLLIVTNAGGPGVLAADEFVSQGGELVQPGAQLMERLNSFLSPNWSHANPIDILGDATPEIFATTLHHTLRDPDSDCILLIVTPQAMTDPTGIARLVAEVKAKADAEGVTKPLYVAYTGGPCMAEGASILKHANIPVTCWPDEAARLVHTIQAFNHEEAQPEVEEEFDHAACIKATAELISKAVAEGRTLLSEYESKQIFRIYGLPTAECVLATTEKDAVVAARRVRANAGVSDVVVKLHSNTISHKTDVGGVQLHLRTDNDVAVAFRTIKENISKAGKSVERDFLGVTVQPYLVYESALTSHELILGATSDPLFGPVVLFGAGGTLVEVFKDTQLIIPPVSHAEARTLIKRTKISKALRGIRGAEGVNMDALCRVVSRFSLMVEDHPWVKDVEINPLLATPQGITALDARVVLWPRDPMKSVAEQEAALPQAVLM